MLILADGIRSAPTKDGTIVLAIQLGQVLRLNMTGSLILELLQSGGTETEIVDAIVARFGVSRQLANQDVSEFLKQLERLRLITTVGLSECNDQ
jgi:hypothetical protein